MVNFTFHILEYCSKQKHMTGKLPTGAQCYLKVALCMDNREERGQVFQVKLCNTRQLHWNCSHRFYWDPSVSEGKLQRNHCPEEFDCWIWEHTGGTDIALTYIFILLPCFPASFRCSNHKRGPWPCTESTHVLLMMRRPFNRTPWRYFNEFLIFIFYPLLKQRYKWVAQRALLGNQVFFRLPHESFFFSSDKAGGCPGGNIKEIPVIMPHLSCLHIADSTASSIKENKEWDKI